MRNELQINIALSVKKKESTERNENYILNFPQITLINLMYALLSYDMIIYDTPSGRISKVVASHAEDCKVDSRWGCTEYTMHEALRGTAH